jgi:hypothetical protein
LGAAQTRRGIIPEPRKREYKPMLKLSKYKQVKINLTLSDHAKFSEVAASQNISMAELIRRRIGAEIENAPAPKSKHTTAASDPKLLYELNRIGNNLNQIAKYVNKTKTIDIQVLRIMVQIEAEIKQLL